MGGVPSGVTSRPRALIVLPLLVALGVGLAAPAAAGPQADPSPPVLREEDRMPPIGLEGSSASEACTWEGREGEDPIPFLVTLGPEELGASSPLRDALECARDRGLQVVVRIEPPVAWQQDPDPYGTLAPWTEALEVFLQRSHEGIAAVQIGSRPERSFDPLSYAFLVEKIGTLLRSLKIRTTLALGAMGEGAERWFEDLPASRLAPHVQAVAFLHERSLELMGRHVRERFPGVALWLHTRPEREPHRLLRALLSARAAGAATILVAPGPPEGASARMLRNLIRHLPSRFVLDPEPPGVTVHAPPRAEPIGYLADPLGPERAILLPSGGSAPAVRLSIGPDPISQIRATDLISGEELAVEARRTSDASAYLLEMPAGPGPTLMRFVMHEGPRIAPETIGVTAAYELTADEIIARLRAFQAAERRRLDHYAARAALSYHYRADAINEAIDVASLSHFYWKEGVGEYEETDLFINGARWRGKAPSLPFVQAKKVREVPIEIRLDASYVYRRAGLEKVGGRPCYVLEFDPAREERALYSGRLWIDETTFALRRIRMVQHGLEAPITSNTDVIEYDWVEGSAQLHWLPVRGYRQMVFTVLGRSVAVEREVEYTDFVVNGPDFESRRARAYESDRPILREDADGYAFLVRDGDGRRVRQTESLRNVAIFGAIRVNADARLGSGAAGINYFDFDWRGTGTQVDLAFAGTFLNGVWTDPSLGKSRWELSVEGRFVGVPEEISRTTDEGSRGEEKVDLLKEQALVALARPLSFYTKTLFLFDLTYEGYGPTSGTSPDMVLPADTITATSTAVWKYHRDGFLLDLWASASKRFGWEDWGLVAGAGGSAEEDTYQKWGAEILKSFFPGPLQKVALGFSYDGGRNLDRFSRFRIGDFGSVRVRGFNGADIGFDHGLAAHLGYSVALPRGGASLEFLVDAALIDNEEDFTQEPRAARTATLRSLAPEKRGSRERLVGGGVSVSFSGPWGTLARISVSQRLGTSMDLPDRPLAFRLVMIKTFDDWPWKRRGAPIEETDQP
jgi:hypothetical protein